MHTNPRFVSALAMAGLLVAVALSSGCGFFCFADWQCPTGCCVRFRCINDCIEEIKVRIDDAPRAPDFTDMLALLFPPAELAQY